MKTAFKVVVMEWARPFDILLKYKGFLGKEGGENVYKKEELTKGYSTSSVVSNFLNEVRTFFIANQIVKPA